LQGQAHACEECQCHRTHVRILVAMNPERSSQAPTKVSRVLPRDLGLAEAAAAGPS
jgi:hypothetical protein